jgi:hypothetical protein
MEVEEAPEREQQEPVDEDNDRNDISQKRPPCRECVEQKRPDPGRKHDTNQKQRDPVVGRLAPPQEISGESRHNKGGVGDGVDRF